MPDLIRNTHYAFDWNNAVNAGLSVGDEIHDILKNGEEVTFAVVEQGVLGLKDCLRTPHFIAERGNTAGDNMCLTAMHNYLNEEIFKLLPDALQAIIKPRRFICCGEIFESKLWLFSEIEIFGEHCMGKDDTDVPCDSSEHQYEYFKTPSHRVKTLGGQGNAAFWWERSPFKMFPDFYCCVHTGGGSGYYPAETPLGICFGFLI